MKAVKFNWLFVACAIVLLAGVGPATLGDWNPGDPHKMHFPQLPDPQGWDVCVVDQWVADDFMCTKTAPIDDIHFWVSWRGDLMGDINMLAPDISIWSNAGGRPGARLWTWNGEGDVAFRLYGTGVQGWVCPSAGEMMYPDHKMFLQVNITNIADPYTQKKDTTYWLVVRVGLPPTVSQRIGWKTSKNDPPAGSLWGKPALWSADTLNWTEVTTGTTVRQVHDMAFVINGKPQPPFGPPTLSVGGWINPEAWHAWIEPGKPVPVQLQVTDPCNAIECVEFSYSLDSGQTWVLFDTDCDGNEPYEDTIGGSSNRGDGWTGHLMLTQPVVGVMPILIKGTAHYADSFFDVFTELSLDSTPPSSVRLNIEDWQTVEKEELVLDVDPLLADIQYICVYVQPKPEEYKKGIPGISQQPHSSTHCAPTAAAACLKYFEGQGDGEICGGLGDHDLVDALADKAKTNQGQSGTNPSDLANAMEEWAKEHGDGYTVRGPKAFDWKEVRDELERSQDVLVGIYWTGGGGHRMTMNSIVNRPLPNGKIRVDFMDPWTGTIEYGDLDPATGQVTNFEGAGASGSLGNIIIVCPKEDDPSGGGGEPHPGPDPGPIPIPLPDPGLYTVRIVVVDRTLHAATIIRIVEKQASEFGDAPEGALAYPDTCKKGAFPTCMNVGPLMSFIRHASSGRLFFGPKLDLEVEGNAGACPMFNPNTYNQDECFQDGDAGLILPPAYTIVSVGPIGDRVVPCVASQTGSLGTVCTAATWGKDVDIHVTNNTTTVAYVNVLMDWNRSGEWSGAIACPPCLGGAVAPEHVLVDFQVPGGYSGRLSALMPVARTFMIGPYPEYIWTRFTVTPNRMGSGWTGDGVSLADGETEDYLLHVKPAPVSSDCDWNVGDDHKMHHPQLPDLSPTGVDVDMFWTPLADDFKCSQTGTITDIHFWGSFADDCLPAGGPASLTFQVTIYSDIPANESSTGYSMPGEPLWTRRFEPCTYTVRQVADSNVEDWYDPATKLYLPRNHFNAYQYNICLTDADVWEQQAGRIYWLEIKDIIPADIEADYTFGWKTTQLGLRWNDDAVYRDATGMWAPLRYPPGHPYSMLPNPTLDLAFVITGEAAPPPDTDWGDAPDGLVAPGYPTLAIHNGASHPINPRIYMGNTVDPDPDGQPTVAADGDDTDADGDDEDGVSFDTPMIPGAMAQITVNASIAGALISTWVDFAGDGSWAQPQDYVVQSVMSVLGNNVFAFPVPAGAVPGTQAYVRVRFTTFPRIGFDGPAPNGEVEDYVVTIEAPYEPKPPVEHVKWSQPPIEIDPLLGRMPTYCGWDEPSFSTKEIGIPQPPAFWQIAADDFRCLGTMPITSVHWWGSYKGWLERNPPAGQKPEYWQIAFWTNAPIDVIHPYSRPQKLLWSIRVKPERVEEVWVGMDHFPNPDVIPDSCFQYFVKLQPEECFWQEKYIASQGGDTVFWISITAVYRGFPGPLYPWGWKTRPAHWMDDGVRFSLRQDNLQVGQVLDPATITPIEASICGAEPQSFDLAFELDTDPNYIKWEQPFTGLRHWLHYEDVKSMGEEHTVTVELTKYEQVPDLTETGIDVDATFTEMARWLPQRLADDFPCETSGLITDIHIWGSWYHDMLPGMPPFHPGNVAFKLSIHADIPASTSPTGYSMPGAVLWTKEFQPGQFEVSTEAAGLHEGYFVPCAPYYEPLGDTVCWRYDFYINPSEAFPQKGAPGKRIVYWLGVEARPIGGGTLEGPRFGWKTCRYDKRWNDDAVWQTNVMPISRPWEELKYPVGHRYAGLSMDLAFKITTQETHQEIVINQLVADDWECHRNTPITAAVWWGSYLGYRYEACVCQTGPGPVKPDYFLLQIWPDVPANVDLPYSHPDQKPIWEYKAYNYDEVLVGFDKHPEPSEPGQIGGKEPVFRYSVRLPKEKWFGQKEVNGIYWFSVVAVYKNPLPVIYPWGWTNHKYIGRIDNAVAGTMDPTGAGWEWRELFDQTGLESVDMSFILFTEPGCFPSSFTTYADWLTYGKPDCWCNSAIKPSATGDYQCDGDGDGKTEGALKYRVFSKDLIVLSSQWKKKMGEVTDPCADFDHKAEGALKYRVFTKDLGVLVANWKKKDADLPANCGTLARPE